VSAEDSLYLVFCFQIRNSPSSFNNSQSPTLAMNPRICKTKEFSGFNQQGNAYYVMQMWLKSWYCNCRLYAQPSAETCSADSNLAELSAIIIFLFVSTSVPPNVGTVLPSWPNRFLANRFQFINVITAVLNVLTALRHRIGASVHLTTPRVHSHTSRCKNKHL